MTQAAGQPPLKTPLVLKPVSLRAKLILGFSLIAAFASFFTAYAIYTNTQRRLVENFRRRVLTAVAITALQQDGDDFEKISSGTEPLYEKFRLQNLEILRSDTDFVYVYTMRKDAQGIYFVVDGNELDAEGFSFYGDRYLEPSPFLVENFDSMTNPIVEPDIYTDEYGSFLSAYAPIRASDGRQVGVVAVDIAADTIVQEQRQILVQSTLIFLVVLAFGIILGYLAGNALTRPVTKLARGALAFASGRFDQRVDINTQDEIGDLAGTLNKMADEIQNLIASLENRVSDRTKDLDASRLLSERRAFELQTIGEISTIISGEKNIQTLLPLVTRLVSERFDFYHVGIFLLDETRQFAILQAANSSGGQTMLARGHRLEVGGSGIVGYVAKYGTPRIAMDVGLDAVFFNNPDLPTTRSEMGLPLNARGHILGVLDIQSDVAGAFTDSDANTLTILADQIAIAIENARLIEQTQTTLKEYETLYRQNIREGWADFSREEPVIGFQQTPGGGKKLLKPVESDEIRESINLGKTLVLQPNSEEDDSIIVVPVKLHGQTIGTLKVQAPVKNRVWSQDEINLASAVSERLSLALENTRLIQDSQKQAIKEQTISEVTTRIGASIDLRGVLQTAVEELGRAMPGSDVYLQLKSDGESSGNSPTAS